jgi:flagellar hook-basal body complex protein FliE
MNPIGKIDLAKQILAAAEPRLSTKPTTHDFGAQLKQALSEVAQAQQKSSEMVKAFEAGQEVDVTKVMLAREKSSLAFEATLQIRNKLLSAYKDIVSMPV